MLVNTQLFVEPQGYYVYCYYDKATPFYIGMGKRKRAVHHLHPSRIRSRKSVLFYNKLSKMLYNNITPSIRIIKSNLSIEDAKRIECKYIKWIGRRDLKLGTLCNLTDGGEGHRGYIKSEELKKRISSWSKGKKLSKEHIEILRKVNLGKKLSEETKIKISKFHKGRKKKKFSEEHVRNMGIASKRRWESSEYRRKHKDRFSKSVIQCSLTGEFIKNWNSHIDAAESLQGRADRILGCCRGNIITHKKFKWIYAS